MAVRVNKANFDQKVLENILPVVVDFYSDSCIPCKIMNPVLGDLEDNYEGKLEVVKVNTNFDQELSEKYSVQSNPTILVFKDGQEQLRKVGVVPYKELESLIAPFIS